MKATILLAEDERDMREVLCDYFTAKSGGELTRQIARSNPKK